METTTYAIIFGTCLTALCGGAAFAVRLCIARIDKLFAITRALEVKVADTVSKELLNGKVDRIHDSITGLRTDIRDDFKELRASMQNSKTA